MPLWTPATLEAIPRLGWVDRPTSVTELPDAAAGLGLGWLGVKRDDQLDALRGGNKVRKLDFLLAAEPFASSARWAAVGAIGSGHLVATVLAAARLGRTVEAHTFWEPPSASVLENLACIASGPSEVRFWGGRLALAAGCPGVLLGRRGGAIPAIPPGGSSPEGVVGAVAGGLELAAQIDAGELPAPDVVYLPWGTGGTAAGVALGLALAGRPVPVWAVAAVEPWFVPRRRFGRLVGRTLRFLAAAGLHPPPGFEGPDVVPVRGFVGAGYGHVSPAAADSVSWLAAQGVRAEPIYGGKSLAALQAHAPALQGRRVLYWLTSHRGGLPTEDDWARRLPSNLSRRLAGRGPGWSRRRLLTVGAAAAGLVGLRHLAGYEGLEGWRGSVLGRREALVLVAAAEAVLPFEPGPLPADGPGGQEVAQAVDRYLTGMPTPMLREIHALFELIEQGTVLDGRLSRLTELPPRARRRFLHRLLALGAPLADAARGLRDLCVLGWYQDPRTWEALGYAGPWVPPGGTGTDAYSGLVAPPGREPAWSTP